MKERQCTTCGETDIKNFEKGRKTSCKKCCWKITKERRKDDVDYRKRAYSNTKSWTKRNILRSRLNNARIRCKKTGMPIDIDLEFLNYLYAQQDGRCAYTNIQFNSEDPLYTLSIDRIDSKKGYIKENVQLVLTAINYMKQEYLEKDFIHLCKLVYLNSL